MPRAIATALLTKTLDSVPKTESGAIDLTKAEEIAQGGTHVLYRFPEAPFVIKVMRQNPSAKELDELEKKYAVLYDSFDKDGKQRCIREQHITHQVLLPGKKEPQSAALSFVPYEKCFKAKIKFDFKIEPAELDPYLVEHYQELFFRANKTLIPKGSPEAGFNLNEYTIIDERVGAILQRLDNDPTLRDTMIEFLNHYRDFYQKTNIILDAVGFENILFFKDESGDWQFKVGSAIKHDTGKYTNELFNTLQAGNEVDLNDFVNFTHAYYSPANIRAVTICAMKLGLEPVINDVTIDPNNLFQISQKLSTAERMFAYARHGDFEKMDKILQENKEQLSFNLKDFWTYPRIAEEYIKHGRPPLALQHYLDTVSKFPVVLPEPPCALVKMLQEPQLEDFEKTKKDQYIITDNGLWYFDCTKNSLEKLIFLEGKSLLSLSEVLNLTENRSANKEELALIISFTGHTQPRDEEAVKRIQDSKTTIIDYKKMHDNKIMLHKELTAFLPKANSHNDKEQPVALSGVEHKETPEAIHNDGADVPNTEPAASPKLTERYKDRIHEIRRPEPGYMAPTESSQAKEREKLSPSPFQTTPKPPWKP